MTAAIKLRTIQNGDHKIVQKMFAEFNASEFGKYDPIENTDDAHVLAFLENMVQNHVIYAISLSDSDEMIGYICFHVAGEEFDIGYMILAEYRGAGIATAASEMAMERVNEERGAKVFTATVAAENIPSVRVLEKLGFSRVSEKRVKKEENGTEYFITERRYEKRFSCDI